MPGLAALSLTEDQRQFQQRRRAPTLIKALLKALKALEPRIELNQATKETLLYTALYFIHRRGDLPEGMFNITLCAALSLAWRAVMRNDIPFELLLVAYVSLMKPEMMKQMRDRPDLWQDSVLPTLVAHFTVIRDDLYGVLEHPLRPYQLGAAVRTYLSTIGAPWCYTDETLEAATALIYDVLTTSLPTDCPLVVLAVALVRLIADAFEHPIEINEADTARLCAQYGSEYSLTDEEYTDIRERLVSVQAHAAEVEAVLTRAELAAELVNERLDQFSISGPSRAA